jgi:hypothetical protein
LLQAHLPNLLVQLLAGNSDRASIPNRIRSGGVSVSIQIIRKAGW